jgi:hypothetical protein
MLFSQHPFFYFVQLVVDILADDCLNEDALTGAVIDVSLTEDSENKEKYTEELRSLFKSFNISTLIGDIIEELLLYGEYCLSVISKPNKGIIEINDNIMPGSVIALYDSSFPKVFYKLEGNKYEARGVGVQANLQATTLGEDTGVACVRAGGVPNMTLKLTGKLTYESQGLCLVGTCTYTTAVTKNFSCY